MPKLKGDKPISKLINGKRYDIDRANELIKWESKDVGQKEALYRKKTGELFLYIERSDDFISAESKSEYIPLDIENARKWVEKRFDKKTADKLFNIPEDKEKKKIISCTFSGSCLKKIQYLMEEYKETRSGLIERLVAKEYEKLKKQRKERA